jgi:hypothetical protein
MTRLDGRVALAQSNAAAVELPSSAQRKTATIHIRNVSASPVKKVARKTSAPALNFR